MRRLIVFFGIALILVGVRIYDRGVFRLADGDLTVFGGGTGGFYHLCDGLDPLFFPDSKTVYRIDLGPDFDVNLFLTQANAKIVLTEEIGGGGKIIHAHSPLISNSAFIHGRRSNIMIHISKSAVNIGIPVLKGSF